MRLQYSLRALLALISVCGISLGYALQTYRSHRRAFEAEQGALAELSRCCRDPVITRNHIGPFWLDSVAPREWSQRVTFIDAYAGGFTDDDLPLFAAFKSLRAARVGLLSGPAVFKNACMLTHLDDLELYISPTPLRPFTDNHLRSIACLGNNLTNLNITYFEASDGGVTDSGLKDIAPLKNLENLTLIDSEVTGSAFAAINRTNRLRYLWMAGLPVCDEALVSVGAWTNLETLGLSETAVTDDGLEHLAGLTRLGKLQLEKMNVTGHAFRRLSGLRSLEYLWLADCPVASSAMCDVARIESLSLLGLIHTHVDDGGLAHLVGMSQLRRLELYGSRFTDRGLVHVRRMRGLRDLSLNGRFTHRGLLGLREMKWLQRLDIKSRCSAEVVDQLRAALPSTKINPPSVFHVF